jgi:putative mycofactocin binding protein MftB
VAPASPTAFDAAAPWRLSPQVSLRDEPFGALAYHHGSRRLVFLKSPELVELVRGLDRFDSAQAAMEQSVSPGARSSMERALASLAASGVIDGR